MHAHLQTKEFTDACDWVPFPVSMISKDQDLRQKIKMNLHGVPLFHYEVKQMKQILHFAHV